MRTGALAYARMALDGDSWDWTRCLKGAKDAEGPEASWL
jgi:hypothetical protein